MANKQILIVDDAIDLGRLLQDALKTAYPGIPITVVPSAEEAILESTRFTIGLLVSDIRLPGMTGFELVRKIRARQPGVKVMLISGLSIDTRLRAQLDEINADAFLHKPMGMPQFLDLCAELLEIEKKPLVIDAKPAPRAEPAAQKARPASKETEALLGDLARAMPGVAREDLVVKPAGASGAKKEPPAEQAGASARIAALRSSLGALAVLLLDESGRRMEQAGELPDQALLDPLISAAMTTLSSAARLSYLLSQPECRSVQAYRGKDFDMVLAPVGQFALMVVLKASKSALRLAIAFEETLNAQEGLAADLEAMGLHIRSSAEAGAPETVAKAAEPQAVASTPAGVLGDPLEKILAGPIQPEPGLEKFEELLSGAAFNPAAASVDADSFWDSAVGSKESSIDTPGVLSYEQAKKLGLLP